jgi:hypothetical protein
MADKLHLSLTLSLPTEYVTGTGGILAVRGAGKTNASRLMAEQMFAAGYPFVAVDPVGSWYGLRAGRDGAKRGGLDVFIFGGKHGDVPLTRESGELVADVIVDQRLACVLDLTEFNTEADKKYFLLKFATRLFKRNTEPLHLFLEEADDYIPQKPMRDELHLKRAWENIVRRGRSRGLGMTVITQRSAVVNKDVLTQVENLFVLRTTGPQDIKAVAEWVKYHSVDDSMLASLSSLDDGEAWIWSPRMLKEFKRFKFNLSQTFDSGATPKGKRGRPVATLRDVDVGKLKGRIQETIEKAMQENPAALRSQIAKLKAEVHNLGVTADRKEKTMPLKPAAVVQAKLPKIPKMKMPNLKPLASSIDKLRKAVASVENTVHLLQVVIASNEKAAQTFSIKVEQLNPSVLPAKKGGGVSTLMPPTRVMGPNHPHAKLARKLEDTVAKREARLPVASGDVKLTATPRAQLAVLAAVYPKQVSLSYLALMSKYSIKSSGFANGLSALRTAGLAEGRGKTIAATEQGVSYNGPTEPLPEGKELLEFWKSKVTACPACLLEVLYNVYPRELTKEELAAASATYSRDGTPYSLTSSGFANGLSMLRSLGLIKGYDKMKASPELFGEVEDGAEE